MPPEEPIEPDPTENEDAPEDVKNPARGLSDEEVEGKTLDVDEDPATDEEPVDPDETIEEEKGIAPGDV
jgi:hypothetical protein